ncbi:hypothetical protein BGX27_011253 [Mortierella sp. AM989]|nr:hypothetical protein BGX27_011253 [Mortierella sp. AM989]
MSLTPNATAPHSTSHSSSDSSVNDDPIPIASSSTPATTWGALTPVSTLPLEPSFSPSTTLSITSTADSITSDQKFASSIVLDAVSDSFSNLTVNSSLSSDLKSGTDTKIDSTKEPKVVGGEEEEEELSPEEAKLRANGLKSTHRPGFYTYINSPRRLRIQTKSKTFDLDRYCPHANADLLKWGVLRTDMTLRCGVHYWGFDLVKNGQCIAHPDETLNACPVAELEW